MRRRVPLAALLAVIAASACGSNDPPPAAQHGSVHEGTETGDGPASDDRTSEHADSLGTAVAPAPHGTRDGLFAADGSPDPRACQHPDDCVGDTVPDVRQPCCNDPRSLDAFNTAYRRWVHGWRATQCADVRCPPPPPPSLPRRCRFEMRCVEGRCADSCD